jgi:hypothetical protein
MTEEHKSRLLEIVDASKMVPDGGGHGIEEAGAVAAHGLQMATRRAGLVLCLRRAAGREAEEVHERDWDWRAVSSSLWPRRDKHGAGVNGASPGHPPS